MFVFIVGMIAKDGKRSERSEPRKDQVRLAKTYFLIAGKGGLSIFRALASAWQYSVDMQRDFSRRSG
jgi:hypothetical protein